MPQGNVTVPQDEFRSLVREMKRGIEVCGEVSTLRIALQALAPRLVGKVDKKTLEELKTAIDACASVSRLRVELFAFERRLREFDQELTPVRPPSRTDIKAAFENSVEFAQGKKKPPERDS